ncbi:MAG: hypothetical protein HC796_03595 [Synechococcaceae cyanobacterium RL_1_2]|nr:hypothetical protein [Synechococcaceae cyanobacterium RL_1_2]
MIYLKPKVLILVLDLWTRRLNRLPLELTKTKRSGAQWAAKKVTKMLSRRCAYLDGDFNPSIYA